MLNYGVNDFIKKYFLRKINCNIELNDVNF